MTVNKHPQNAPKNREQDVNNPVYPGKYGAEQFFFRSGGDPFKRTSTGREVE